MKLCISQATTLGTPFEADLDAYAGAGWHAVELWLTKLETFLDAGHSPAEAAARLADRGLAPVAAAGQGGLLLSRDARRTEAWGAFRRRLDLLAALAVPVLVVAVDFDRDLVAEDYGRASASLAEAAELAGRSGVRLAVEFQKQARFCASLDTTLALIAQSGAANVGVCLDVFHYYCGPSKFEDLDHLTAANLAWVQVSDVGGVPRELAGDADRILPGEGDFQLEPILERVAAIDPDRYLSLEVLNPTLWSIPADQVAGAGLQSMARLLGPRPAARGADRSRGAS